MSSACRIQMLIMNIPHDEFTINVWPILLQVLCFNFASNDSKIAIDKHKQSLVEQIETPASRREIRYRRACEKYFESLLRNDADPEETIQQPALQAEVLCSELQSLGMAPEVTEDELCSMLKSSGYADQKGTLGFERFMVLAKDLKLIESMKASKKERIRGNNLDRGLLGEFFKILDIGEQTGFSSSDFVDALGSLSSEITDGTAENFVRYANLQSGVKISFKQFERVLLRARVEYYLLR